MQASYFQTAWADIKNSPGWFGKLCVLGLLLFIPVFGPIVLYGYAFGWARDMAWDVHRPMPSRIFGNEDGKLYSRGFFAWLILLVASIIPNAISVYAGDNSFWMAVALAADLFLSIFAMVGVMRMAIYGRLGAGFQINRMWSMTKHDTSGLLRILGMVILISLIVGVVFGIVISIVIVGLVFAGIGSAGASVDWNALVYSLQSNSPGAEAQVVNALQAIAPVLGIAVVLILVFVYALLVFQVWVVLLQARAMGYWTRQFDVAHWGGQDDPMPFEVQAARAAQFSAAQQAQQYQQGQYQQPQQGQYQPPVQNQQYAQPQQQYQQPYQQQPQPYQQQPVQQPGVQGQAPQATQVPQAAQSVAQPQTQPVVQPAQQATQQFTTQPVVQPIEPAPPAVAAQPATPASVTQPVAAAPAETAPAAEKAAEAAQPATPAYVGRPSSMEGKIAEKSPVAPKWEKIDLSKLDE